MFVAQARQPVHSAAAKSTGTAKPGTAHTATAARSGVCPKVSLVDDSKVPPLPKVYGCKMLRNGIAYIDSEIGFGSLALRGMTASVRYTVRLTNGTVVDSTEDGSRSPLLFEVEGGHVIAGFDSGLEGMREGGERRLFIPSKFAYGSKGTPAVPVNSDLIMDVKLMAVNEDAIGTLTDAAKKALEHPSEVKTAAAFLEQKKPLAASGDVQAESSLGLFYLISPPPFRNYALAAEWARKAVAGGNKDSRLFPAIMMLMGDGMPRNEVAARRTLKEMSGDNPFASVLLNSLDLPANKELLEASYRSAFHPDLTKLDMGTLQGMVDQGNIEAIKVIVEKNTRDKTSGSYGDRDTLANFFHLLVATWYRYYALKGNAQAEEYLGDAFHAGEGVPQNDYTAVEWYKKAAKDGSHSALLNLAYAYWQGNGVEQNESKGMEIATQAANMGYMPAEYSLGYRYQVGLSGMPTMSEALSWYQKAADQGYYLAEYVLGSLYQEGRNVPQDYGKALRYYQASADQGFPAAARQIGIMCRDGQGVTANREVARQFFQKAGETKLIAEMDQKTLAEQQAIAAARARQKQQQREQEQQAQARARWQAEVNRLTSEVQEAEQDAVNAEALARTYSNNANNVSSSASTLADVFASALNSGASVKYQHDADKKRRRANELRGRLDALHADQPPEVTQANNSSIVDMAKSSGDNYVANSIANQQQQAQLNATMQQLAAMRTQASAQPVRSQSSVPASKPYTAPAPKYTTTGTAKPPVASAPAPVQQTASVNPNVCPASGWIMHQRGDVSVGEQCTPGRPINTSSSGSGGSTVSSSGGSGSTSSGSGGASSGGGRASVSGLNSCVQSYFGGHDDFANYVSLRFRNNCNVKVSIVFFNNDADTPRLDYADPGGTTNTFSNRKDVTNLHYYSCPMPSVARAPGDHAMLHPTAQYMCPVN